MADIPELEPFDNDAASTASAEATADYTALLDEAPASTAADAAATEKVTNEAVEKNNKGQIEALTRGFRSDILNGTMTTERIQDFYDKLNDLTDKYKSVSQTISELPGDKSIPDDQEVSKPLVDRAKVMLKGFTDLFSSKPEVLDTLNSLKEKGTEIENNGGKATSADLEELNDLSDKLAEQVKAIRDDPSPNEIKDKVENSKDGKDTWDKLLIAVKVLMMLGSGIAIVFAFLKYMHDTPSCAKYDGASHMMIDATKANCNCTIPSGCSDISNGCSNCSKDQQQKAVCLGNAVCAETYNPTKNGSIFYSYIPPSLGGFIGSTIEKGIVDPAKSAGDAIMGWIKQLETPLLLLFGMVIAFMVIKVVLATLEKKNKK
jgi:hypothetical protein